MAWQAGAFARMRISSQEIEREPSVIVTVATRAPRRYAADVICPLPCTM